MYFAEYNIRTRISQNTILGHVFHRIQYWDTYFTEYNIRTCISQNAILGHVFHRIQ